MWAKLKKGTENTINQETTCDLKKKHIDVEFLVASTALQLLNASLSNIYVFGVIYVVIIIYIIYCI